MSLHPALHPDVRSARKFMGVTWQVATRLYKSGQDAALLRNMSQYPDLMHLIKLVNGALTNADVLHQYMHCAGLQHPFELHFCYFLKSKIGSCISSGLPCVPCDTDGF